MAALFSKGRTVGWVQVQANSAGARGLSLYLFMREEEEWARRSAVRDRRPSQEEMRVDEAGEGLGNGVNLKTDSVCYYDVKLATCP